MPHCLHVYSRKQLARTTASIRQSAALWDRLCSTQCGWDTCRLRTWGSGGRAHVWAPANERFLPRMAETKQKGPSLSRDVEGCPLLHAAGADLRSLVVCPVGGRGTARPRHSAEGPHNPYQRRAAGAPAVHVTRHQAFGARLRAVPGSHPSASAGQLALARRCTRRAASAQAWQLSPERLGGAAQLRAAAHPTDSAQPVLHVQGLAAPPSRCVGA